MTEILIVIVTIMAGWVFYMYETQKVKGWQVIAFFLALPAIVSFHYANKNGFWDYLAQVKPILFLVGVILTIEIVCFIIKKFKEKE